MPTVQVQWTIRVGLANMTHDLPRGQLQDENRLEQVRAGFGLRDEAGKITWWSQRSGWQATPQLVPKDNEREC